MDKRFPDCSLTIRQEEGVCALYRSGIRSYELARRFSVAQSTIMRTLRAHSVPISRKTYSYDENFFDVIDTEAKAYFLGLLTADGYVVDTPKRYVVQLYLADRELVEGFRDAIGSDQPIYEVAPNPLYKTHSTKWMLAVGSKAMVRSLARFGVIQAKSQREVFTEHVPDELDHHYMRGLFDGDGTCGVYDNGAGYWRPHFGLTGSEHVLRTFLSRLNRHVGTRPFAVRHSSGRHQFQIAGAKHVGPIADFLYRDANIYLGRKRAILAPFMGAPVV